MSGIYFQPRTPSISSTEIIKAFESLTPTSGTTPEESYFSGFKRGNQIFKFTEPAYQWWIESPYANPQLGSVYVDSIDSLKLPKPLRVEADWERLDTYIVVVRFDRFECSGFAILN